MASTTSVRVRFAPSPTGLLHLGGLRTALYNYLFARKHNGTFILRIEDTDQARHVEGATEHLLQTLAWAGISPDEGYGRGGEDGPYLQSQRLNLYHQAVSDLVTAGLAYRCNYTQEEMEEFRKVTVRNGSEQNVFKRRYARDVLGEPEVRERDVSQSVVRLDTEAVAEKMRKGNDSAISGASMHVIDEVKGRVSFPLSGVDDCVLLKSDSFPTYHLANVVDDTAMRISHVIRGEEWLSSSPKHLLLYAALQTPPPAFAHLPLLLNASGGKLSKRHEHGSVEALRAHGYEPEALLAFVSRMGFTPSTDLISLPQLAQEFDLGQIHSASVQMNLSKLEHLQSALLRASALSPSPTLLRQVINEVNAAVGPSCHADPLSAGRVLDEDFHAEVLRVVHERISFRSDVAKSHLYFWEDPPATILADNKKLAGNALLLRALRRLSTALHARDPAATFGREEAQAAIEASRSEREGPAQADQVEGTGKATAKGKAGQGQGGAVQVGKGPLMKALRLVVTGAEGGPELLDVLVLLGPGVVARRVAAALSSLSDAAAA